MRLDKLLLNLTHQHFNYKRQGTDMRSESIVDAILPMSYQERRRLGLQARFTFSSPKDTPPVVIVNDGELEELPIVDAQVVDNGDRVRVDRTKGLENLNPTLKASLHTPHQGDRLDSLKYFGSKINLKVLLDCIKCLKQGLKSLRGFVRRSNNPNPSQPASRSEHCL